MSDEPTNWSIEQLIRVLVAAIRAQPEKAAMDVAARAARATGYRRAIWATLTPHEQDALIIQALRRVRAKRKAIEPEG